MANPEVALVMDDLEEKLEVASLAESSKELKVASNPPDSKSETKVERLASAKGESGSITRRVLSAKETRDSQASLFLKWKKIFLASCVLAVLLDPLFLYIPIINQDLSCLGVDNKLKITTLVLRSLTDLFYIMDIAFQFYKSESCSGLISKFRHRNYSVLQYLRNFFLPATAKTIWKSHVLIDILAVLPLPQVAILSYFSKMRFSSSLNTRKVVMNLVVLMQYLPRVLRIYFSCDDLRRTPNGGTGETAIWVKGVLNFFMYILASHVLGAVWYFLAVQRMTDCWQNACGKGNECGNRNFGCTHVNQTLLFLNESCPISTPETSPFNFGIFGSLLQSGMTGSTNFLQKFSTCFCWGLRNLSSLGSNLDPSINTWENLFVAFISIIGLLLFIYLIGNLQTYMQLDVARIEDRRHRIKVERKMEAKSEEIELWLSKNGIPQRSTKDIKLQILKKVEQELEEDRDVNLENIFSIIPRELQNHIKSCSPLTRLKQVPMLEYLDGLVLKEICDLLKPVKYTNKDIIISADGSLNRMIFIVEGSVIVEKPNCSEGSERGAGELYGEKLLAWPSWSSFPDVLPSATESVKAVGDVEALDLMASDMVSVGSKFSFHFKKYSKLEEQLANLDLHTSLRIFTLQELRKATANFDDDAIIGQGGCGVVYKGTLSDKKVVAIKKSKMMAAPSSRFTDEVIILSLADHRNVVRLLGVCIETQTPLLIYEFVSNGTLYEHIHRKNGGGPLSFNLRVDIAVDTARGLEYLHNFPSMQIIHGDVKSTNILLGDDYTAKVSDFRSLSVPEDQDQLSTLVQGTLGYLDPEYLRSGVLTDKSDVYSFGVVLVELITSQPALISYRKNEADRSLANSFVRSMEEVRLQEIVDPEIMKEGKFEIVEKVADLAMRCLRLERAERPIMKEVARELEGLQIMLKHPGGANANFFLSPKQTDYLLG